MSHEASSGLACVGWVVAGWLWAEAGLGGHKFLAGKGKGKSEDSLSKKRDLSAPHVGAEVNLIG